jgi:5-methylcytosine-specific restriction endonuclease McrA
MCAGGYNTWCKACEREYKRKHYELNKSVIAASNKARYEANREAYNAPRRKGRPTPLTAEERKRRQLASNKRWAANNSDKTNSYKRKWAENNREADTVCKRAWKKSNPYALLEMTKRRQARKKSRTLPLTREDRYARVYLYGLICIYCGKKCNPSASRWHPDKPTEEHLIPLSRGGLDCGANLRLACMECNRKKRDQTPFEYAPDRFAR